LTRISYIEPDGTSRVIETSSGFTVMEVAVRNDVRGIVAECGGACACATCHVYVDDAWMGRLPPPSAVEEAMLELAEDVRANSRLSCQIRISDAIDGLIVRVPASQG
jgi:ferredoxin, 2Fe-2S